MSARDERVRIVAIGRREEEHGTMYPQSPVCDLPRNQITREAMVMLAERWRQRLRCDGVALFDVGASGIFDRETATEIVRTRGFHD